jgi:hypothetical protein
VRDAERSGHAPGLISKATHGVQSGDDPVWCVSPHLGCSGELKLFSKWNGSKSMMAALTANMADASPIDPKQTFVLQQEDIKFVPWDAGWQRRDGEALW